MTEYVHTITDAPEAYDGFGTETVELLGKLDRNGNVVRLVRTPARHAQWQRMRYGSGLHLSLDQSREEDARLFYTPMDQQGWAAEVREAVRAVAYEAHAGVPSWDAVRDRLPAGLSDNFIRDQAEMAGFNLGEQ